MSLVVCLLTEANMMGGGSNKETHNINVISALIAT